MLDCGFQGVFMSVLIICIIWVWCPDHMGLGGLFAGRTEYRAYLGTPSGRFHSYNLFNGVTEELGPGGRVISGSF